MSNFDFGNFLYELRSQRGISQTELGQLVGVSKSSVSKWENGKAIPPMETLHKLSLIFNVTVQELLNGRKEEKIEISDSVSTPDPDSVKHNKTFVKIFMIVLFIATLFSVYLGMFFILSGTMYDTTNIIFARAAFALPIPIASVILGIIFKAKGYNTVKNIVAGFIVSVLLLVMSFPKSVEITTDPKYLTGIEIQLAMDFPDNANFVTTKWEENNSTILQTIGIVWSDYEIKSFNAFVENNEKWKTFIEEEMLPYMHNYHTNLYYQEQQGNYYLLYDKTTRKYNSDIEYNKNGEYIFVLYSSLDGSIIIQEYTAYANIGGK